MIRGSRSLVRQLRAFMEGSVLPWSNVRFVTEHDEEGYPYLDDARIEIHFTHNDKKIGVVIWAPSDTPVAQMQGRMIPCGWLTGRCEGGAVVHGPLDPATWDRIVTMINEGTGQNV
jgi:hypothetical protein